MMRRAGGGNLIALVAMMCASIVDAAERAATPPAAISVREAVAAVASTTGKRFMIDPRVNGEVEVIGARASQLTYDDLLAMLQLQGFAAFEKDGFVRIMPDANIRQQALPIVSGSETRPNAEHVTLVVTLRNRPATHTVPLLRPMLPQIAHLVADPCSNTLVIVDTHANARRIEMLARALDVGNEPYEFECTPDLNNAKAQSSVPPPAPQSDPVRR